jgi:hypothetical protein
VGHEIVIGRLPFLSSWSPGLVAGADSVLTWISQKPVSAGGSVMVDVPLQRLVMSSY